MKWHEVKHTEREKKNRKNRKYKALTQNLRQFEVTEIEQHHVSGEKDEQKIEEPKSVLNWCRLPSSERRLFLLLSVSSVSSSRSRVVPNLVRNEFVVNDDCVSLSHSLSLCAVRVHLCTRANPPSQWHRSNFAWLKREASMRQARTPTQTKWNKNKLLLLCDFGFRYKTAVVLHSVSGCAMHSRYKFMILFEWICYCVRCVCVCLARRQTMPWTWMIESRHSGCQCHYSQHAERGDIVFAYTV